MDPRDDLDSLADGVGCSACGGLVPSDRIRILARRDDLVFVEVACPDCRSDSLGIVVTDMMRGAGAADDPDGAAGATYGEFGTRDRERFRDARPIAAADVEAVRGLLARGGLAALVGGTEPPPTGTAR